MSQRIIIGGLLISMVLNIVLFAWLFQVNQQVQQNGEAITVLESAVSESNQRAEEAQTVASNLREQVENTGTLTRFAVVAISEQLSQLVTQTITLTVPINQQVPIATTIELDKSFEVPIQTVVPINTDVAVPIELGILGQHSIDVPISLAVPIDLTVQVPFSEEIPINTTVPIVMDIPVSLSLKDTPLAAQLAEWQATLGQLGVNARD